MTEETLILMNRLLNILGKMDYKDYLPEFYFNKVDKDFIYSYINETILKDFTKKELEELRSRIYCCKDKYDMCGIVGSRICIPDITNVISSLITIHELYHYEAIKNKIRNFSYMSLYDELIPLNSEFVFISRFYRDNLEEYQKIKFDSIVKAAHITIDMSSNGKIEGIDKKDSLEAINKLSHIYSGLLLIQNQNYEENQVIFDKINKTSNPLEYEFNNKGLYLRKTIINELKNRN